MGLVSHSSGAGRSGGRDNSGHRRKNINPIQVINVNLGFSKNLASLLRKRVKFKLVLSFCRRSEINISNFLSFNKTSNCLNIQSGNSHTAENIKNKITFYPIKNGIHL